MSRLSCLAFLLAACCSCAEQGQNNDEFAEAQTPEQAAAFKELQGTWRLDFSPRHDGSDTFNGEGRLITYTFAADKITQESSVTLEFRYRLRPGNQPKQIDLEWYSSTEPPWVARGIYKLEGKSLVICHAAKNGARPANFSDKVADGRTMLYLTRHQ